MPAMVAAAALVAAAPAAADWTTVGGGPVDENVAAPTSSDGHAYDLKRIGGVLHVAWTDPVGKHVVVRVARLADDGASWIPVGGVVNADPAHDAGHPSLAEAPDGTPWIAWTELDVDDAAQIRVARLNGAGDDWVEPDGRAWGINYLPPDFDEDRPRGDRQLYYGAAPRLVFLGERPYVAYLQNYFEEYAVDVVRLAADGHSWERIVSGLGGSIPRNPDAAVIGGLLHVGINDLGSTEVLRLSQAGQWEKVGGGSPKLKTDDGYEYDGSFDRLAPFGGDPYVLFGQAHVVHPDGDSWTLVGGGPAGEAWRGTSLRGIGGRLWAAWRGDPNNPDGQHPLHVSRLADDSASWVQVDSPAGTAVDDGAVLSSIDGVPYIAFAAAGGGGKQLVVQRLNGAPEPLGPDDPEGSGPGTDPDVDATPIVPPGEPKPHAHCSGTVDGTPDPDYLYALWYTTTVRGFAGDDRIMGGSEGDCLFAGDGSDELRGSLGRDWLFGGNGADKLFGGADDDQLNGGRGNDGLRGGPGVDMYHAGRGRDFLDAADGRGEPVNCGPGEDTARVDASDGPRDCEHVTVVGG